MNRADIKLLFQYNDWANDRILAQAERVSPEQLSAENDFGWGSLRGALVHLMDAEHAWRVLLKTGEHVEWLQPEDFPAVGGIRARWNEERSAFWDYLNSLSDEDLIGTVSYEGHHNRIYHRVLWHCLAHVVNHGTQHRAECAALLTGFGHSPGNLDFSEFLLAR
ncbi:MAG: DinB family protein [Chloroflexi bacterium]|nr:DinB family protein [Chloroflexota bacterium]